MYLQDAGCPLVRRSLQRHMLKVNIYILLRKLGGGATAGGSFSTCWSELGNRSVRPYWISQKMGRALPDCRKMFKNWKITKFPWWKMLYLIPTGHIKWLQEPGEISSSSSTCIFILTSLLGHGNSSTSCLQWIQLTRPSTNARIKLYAKESCVNIIQKHWPRIWAKPHLNWTETKTSVVK